jgi:hypothetical protein
MLRYKSPGKTATKQREQVYHPVIQFFESSSKHTFIPDTGSGDKPVNAWGKCRSTPSQNPTGEPIYPGFIEPGKYFLLAPDRDSRRRRFVMYRETDVELYYISIKVNQQ